jgi:hypothetical protein
VAEVDEGARGAHGGKGAGGDHIHPSRRLRRPLGLNDVDDFLGGYDHHLAGLDLGVDFLKGFGDAVFLHVILLGLKCF